MWTIVSKIAIRQCSTQFQYNPAWYETDHGGRSGNKKKSWT